MESTTAHQNTDSIRLRFWPFSRPALIETSLAPWRARESPSDKSAVEELILSNPIAPLDKTSQRCSGIRERPCALALMPSHSLRPPFWIGQKRAFFEDKALLAHGEFLLTLVLLWQLGVGSRRYFAWVAPPGEAGWGQFPRIRSAGGGTGAKLLTADGILDWGRWHLGCGCSLGVLLYGKPPQPASWVGGTNDSPSLRPSP